MKGKPTPSNDRVRCVEVFHLNQIGDFIFSLPLLATLRQSFPNARIVSVVRPHLFDLCQSCGFVDEVLVRDYSKGFRKIRRLGRALRKRHPDYTFQLGHSLEPCILAWLSRSRARIGYEGTSLSWLLTEKVPWVGIPNSENALRLVEHLGIEPVTRSYFGLLHPERGESHRIAARLNHAGVPSYKRLIVISPGSSAKRTIKQWTDEGFAAVSDHFSAQSDTAVVVAGGEVPSGILGLVKHPVIDMTAQTAMRELVALLERADLFIGIDSGLLHIAAAVGTPVVGIYGPTDPNLTGPQGPCHRIVTHPVDCSPCLKSSCSIGRICLTQLQASEVIAAAEEILSGRVV